MVTVSVNNSSGLPADSQSKFDFFWGSEAAQCWVRFRSLVNIVSCTPVLKPKHSFPWNSWFNGYRHFPATTAPFLWQTTSELWCLSGGKRGDYQNCSVLYCVLKLCTVISTLRWAILTVLWIGFRHTGPISLCIDLFAFICVYFVCFCFILHSCCIIVSTVGWTWWDWSLILRTLSSFSALTSLVGSFDS